MRERFIHFSLLVPCFVITAAFSQQWHALPNPALIGTNSLPVGVGSPCTGCGQVNSLKTINNKLYVGGGFGGSPSGPDWPVGNGIASYDGAIWDSLGLGVSGVSNSIEYYNGEFYFGGNFSTAWSGNPFPNDYVPNTQYLAKWNGGSTLLAVTSLPPSYKIYSLKHRGDLYLGGHTAFTSVGGVQCNRIARYNSSTWDNLLGGVDNSSFPEVRVMKEFKGDLIVAGSFTKAGNVSCNNIARWDGSQWYPLGGGVNSYVFGMATDSVNGNLYVGGSFDSAGAAPAHWVAKWDGAQWSPVGNIPSNGGAYAMEYFDNKLYVFSGDFDANQDSIIYCWNGSTWQVIYGPTLGDIYAFEIYKGNLYVGGTFQKVDTTTVNYIACYGDSCPGTPITLTLPYAVDELSSSLRFKVYPNPAKRELNIQLLETSNNNGKYIIRVKNQLGQEVYRKKFDKELKIDTSQFSKGIFLVEVCTSQGKLCHTEKVVIQ